jgi:hypothetical protein
MKDQLQEEGIIKEEKIGYLKSKVNLLQGNLYLTPKRIVLDAHKTGVGGFGLLGAILKKKVEEKSFGFNLELGEIKHIAQGKHGVQKNVLEITGSNDETYRIIVKDYQEWEDQLKS